MNHVDKSRTPSSSRDTEPNEGTSQDLTSAEGLEALLIDREGLALEPEQKSYVLRKKDGKLLLDTSDPHTKEKALQILRQMKKIGTNSVAVKFEDPLHPRHFSLKDTDKKSGTLVRVTFKARKTNTGHVIQVVKFTDKADTSKEEIDQASSTGSDTVSLSTSETTVLSPSSTPSPEKNKPSKKPKGPRTLSESEKEKIKSQDAVKAKDSREAAEQILEKIKMGRRI